MYLQARRKRDSTAVDPIFSDHPAALYSRQHNDKMERNPHRLRSRLEFDTEFGASLGDTRIRLLEAVATHGPISRAAKAVPLSCKAPGDAIDAMNNLSGPPLVCALPTEKPAPEQEACTVFKAASVILCLYN